MLTLGDAEGTELEAKLMARLEGVYRARPATGDCYMHNVYSESIMPALLAVRAGKATRVSEIYSKKLNPEAITLKKLNVVTAAPVVFEDSFLAAMSSSRQRLSFGEKLLAKCASPQKQDGVRYIRPQVLKALASKDPLDGNIARCFLMCMLLGTMPDAPMASPSLRIRVHLEFQTEVDRALKTLSSRALWLGLIFWVNSAVSSCPVLRRLRAPGGCATSIDRRMGDQLKTVITHVIPAVQGQPNVRVPTFVTRRKNMKRKSDNWLLRNPKKRRLRPDVIHRLTGESDLQLAKIKMSENYRYIMREAPRTPWASSAPVLQKIGWNNPDGQAVYEHAVTQRREFTILPCHTLLAEAQRRAAPDGAFVSVCLECYTLRTRARGQPSNKATEGTILLRDREDAELCANCYSDRVERIDLRGLMITSLNRAIEQQSTMVTVCTGCGYPSVINSIHGLNTLCKACSKMSEMTDCFDRSCACCARVLSKRGHYKAAVFESTRGPPEIRLVCPSCQDTESLNEVWTSAMVTRRRGPPRRSWITS